MATAAWLFFGGKEALVVADDTRAIPLILLAQAGVCLVVGTFAWLWAGNIPGLSALLGGAAAVLPNALTA